MNGGNCANKNNASGPNTTIMGSGAVVSATEDNHEYPAMFTISDIHIEDVSKVKSFLH